MFNYPKDLYTDVRIEEIYETKIVYELGEVQELKTRSHEGGFIRIYDGRRWYYSATTDLINLQKEIDKLSAYATQNINITEDPTVAGFEVHKGDFSQYQEKDVAKIPTEKKQEFLRGYFPMLNDNQTITYWKALYNDKRVVKKFYSSKGAEIIYDTQVAGFGLDMNFVKGEERLKETFQKASHSFEDLLDQEKNCGEFIAKCEEFVKNAKPVKPGKYPVVFAPVVAGVFAHESFGHKSESDFMIGDETMKKEWAIGKKVGADILSIIDDGEMREGGYTPFDDEGTKAKKTEIIKDGILKGRLHSSGTAASLMEGLTGNARATTFEFEPIVRMTNTYIEKGSISKEDLIREIEEGIYVDNFNHGSGMSTFTIAPSLAYYIRDGKIAEPVSVSVVTGNVMKTLELIDGVSDEIGFSSFITGGCGKMEQFPLAVGFGGPYVRVKELEVH